MEIRIPQIKIYSGRMLNFLDSHNLEVLTGLDDYVGKHFPSKDNSMEGVVFSAHISDKGNMVRTMSYSLRGVGLPLEVEFNEVEDYNRYILKCRDTIEAYKQWTVDRLGNPVLDRVVRGCSLDLARRELERLRDL